LVFRSGEELAVIDYKSDHVSAAEMPAAMERHRAQADTYARGVTATTGVSVSEIVFAFARTGAQAEFAPA
jgi:ATP-dependent exoDNAse (exonuclease V) beta subunit